MFEGVLSLFLTVSYKFYGETNENTYVVITDKLVDIFRIFKMSLE